MTRTRNDPVEGVPPQEADVDAKTFTRTILGLVRDFNFLYDSATGQNGIGASKTIQHNGDGGSGSLLGVPLINTHVGRSLSLDDSTTKNLYGEDVYIYAVPVFIPQGETLYRLVVEFPRNDPLDLEVIDTSGANYFGGLVQSNPVESSPFAHEWFLQFTAGSHDLIFLIRAPITQDNADLTLRGIRLYAPRLDANPPATLSVSTLQNPYYVPAPTEGLPADDAMGVEIIPDEMISNNYALSGWVLTKLNHNINALWEYVTGSPVPGNDEVTNTDTGAVDPTTSRFMAHTRSEYASEPLVEWPLFAEGVGCCRVEDGAFCVKYDDPPTDGILDWFAPYPRDVSGGAGTIGHKLRVFVPDFPTTHPLKFRILCTNDNGKGTATAWECRVSTATGDSSWVALTQVGSTFFYTCNITDAQWAPDAANTFELKMRRTSAVFTEGEIGLVGWRACFTVL